ncbi:MAG: MqnA/MqnD/SBP family protein [Bacteroidota bacterium]
MTERKKTFGIPPHYYCRPLVEALAKESSCELRVSAPAVLAMHLRDRLLHTAFLTPLDYARNASEYRIIPGAAVTSRSPSGPISLHFQGGGQELSTLAVDPSSSAEIILARIILAEEFDSFPALVPVRGSVEDMLKRADVALLVGHPSRREHDVRRDTLDLVEAWMELTNLPYVYGFWCARERSLSDAEVIRLQQVHTQIHEARQEAPPEMDGSRVELFDYRSPKQAEDAVREYLHYAFYHGILPDVPDIAYLSVGASNGTGEKEPDAH